MTISDEWWDRWWEQDYSWQGLAQKPWEGWYVDTAWVEGEGFEPVPEDARVDSVDYRKATLQDYWRRAMLEAGLSENDFLVLVENEAWVPKSLRDRHDTRIHFTLMHLPPKWQDGTATIKADPENPPEALIALLKNELGREIRETKLLGPDHQIQWDGVVLPKFRLSNLSPQARSKDGKSPISLSARNAAFSGDADFESAAFSGEAYFESAAFSGEAYFQNAAFSGHADFESAAFSGGAYFNSAAFSGGAYFDSAAFSSDAYFLSAAFSGYADFESAAFSGEAYFRSAAFSGDADFGSAAFSGGANFESAAFSGNANFRSGAFSGNAYFMSAAFLSDAIFSGQGNSVDADPVEAKLSFDISDGNATGTYDQPKQGGWIARRSFPNAYFQNALFLGRALFDNRDFHAVTDWDGADTFDGAKFYKDAVFHGGQVHRGIPVTRTDFESALQPQRRSLDAVPKETLERLHKAASNAAASRQDALGFLKEMATSVMLKENPEKAFSVWRANIETGLQSENAMLKGESAYFQRLEEAFRTLKQIMEDRRDRVQEANFFKLELKARRKRTDAYVTRWDRWSSYTYEWLSDFGTSFLRPLGWLLCSVVFFALIYYGLGGAPWNLSQLGDAGIFSLSRVFPFGPWAEVDPCGTLGHILDRLPPEEGCGDRARAVVPLSRFGFGILGTFQSFMAITLVFLSGLAIRRRFQIN